MPPKKPPEPSVGARIVALLIFVVFLGAVLPYRPYVERFSITKSVACNEIYYSCSAWETCNPSHSYSLTPDFLSCCSSLPLQSCGGSDHSTSESVSTKRSATLQFIHLDCADLQYLMAVPQKVMESSSDNSHLQYSTIYCAYGNSSESYYRSYYKTCFSNSNALESLVLDPFTYWVYSSWSLEWPLHSCGFHYQFGLYKFMWETLTVASTTKSCNQISSCADHKILGQLLTESSMCEEVERNDWLDFIVHVLQPLMKTLETLHHQCSNCCDNVESDQAGTIVPQLLRSQLDMDPNITWSKTDHSYPLDIDCTLVHVSSDISTLEAFQLYTKESFQSSHIPASHVGENCSSGTSVNSGEEAKSNTHGPDVHPYIMRILSFVFCVLGGRFILSLGSMIHLFSERCQVQQLSPAVKKGLLLVICIDHIYQSVLDFFESESMNPTSYWKTIAPGEFDVPAPIYIHEWYEQVNKSNIVRLRNVYASNGSNKPPGSIILFAKNLKTLRKHKLRRTMYRRRKHHTDKLCFADSRYRYLEASFSIYKCSTNQAFMYGDIKANFRNMGAKPPPAAVGKEEIPKTRDTQGNQFSSFLTWGLCLVLILVLVKRITDTSNSGTIEIIGRIKSAVIVGFKHYFIGVELDIKFILGASSKCEDPRSCCNEPCNSNVRGDSDDEPSVDYARPYVDVIPCHEYEINIDEEDVPFCAQLESIGSKEVTGLLLEGNDDQVFRTPGDRCHSSPGSHSFFKNRNKKTDQNCDSTLFKPPNHNRLVKNDFLGGQYNADTATFSMNSGEQGIGLPHKVGRCDKSTTVTSPTPETSQLPQDSQLRYSSSATNSNSPLSDPFHGPICIVEPSLVRLQPVGQDEEDIPPPKPTVSTDTGIGTGSQGQKVKTPITLPFQVKVSDSKINLPVLDSESMATENTGQEVFVSSGTRVAESLLKENFCMNHLSLCAPSNTVHRSEMVQGKTNTASMTKALKERIHMLQPSFKPHVFLSYLNLHRVLQLARMIDVPLFLIKRSRLEDVYKRITLHDATLKFDQEKVGRVISCFPWLEEVEKQILKEKLLLSSRKGWKAIKDSVLAVDMVNISTLARKFGISLSFPIDPTISEFSGILDELSWVHRDKGCDIMTKSQVVHALFMSSAPSAILDEIILLGLPANRDFVTVSKAGSFARLLKDSEVFEKFREVVRNSNSREYPIVEVSHLEKSNSSINHWLCIWLAERAESASNAVSWEDFADMLMSVGVDSEAFDGVSRDEAIVLSTSQSSFKNTVLHQNIQTKNNGRPKDDVPYSVERVQSPTPHRRYEKEPTRIQAPTDEHAKVDHTSSASYQTGSKKSLVSSNHAVSLPSARVNSIHDQEEATLLSKKLDPGNPKSILAHAKSVYLTGDYNRTREILENFNHHLTVEGKMLRAKIFGLGICHYREKDYPPAVKYLDELERVSLEHNAAGDVAVSFIYRGEIHLAQGKYPTAYEMFTRARTAYDTDHVAHLFGIVILSKTSVIIKAGNCQKHLKNISKAKELFHTAVDLAVRSRESVESSSTSLDRKHVDTLRAIYKDEIAARTSLGNLHQNTSDCSKSLDEYRIALKLQEKVDTNCIAYGWAQGNMGSALVGRGKVKEAIPHLTKAYDIAKKFERDYSAVGRAANNLGTAFQADKQYSQAEEYFQIALGHSVYCKDEVGQARSLGNIGNVKLLQGELMEALRCYTETLSLGCDDNALITAYQNRAGVYIALAKQLARGNDWDEVSSDVESVQPKEIQSAEIPVQECTEHHPTENRRLQLVAPAGTYTRLPLDDEQDILNKKQSSPAPSFEGGRRTDSIQQQPLTAFDVLHSDDLTVKHRKYYLERAKEDLLQSVELIEKKFDTLKGEDTNSLALSLFEVNAKAFYHLQKVLILLGDPQEALKVAEQNRGRNLGEILWNKRQRASNMPRPLDLRHIWKVVNRERLPVIVLSYIQQSSTMLVHMVFPRAKSDSFCRGDEGTDFYRENGGPFHSEDRLFHTSTIFHTPALANGSDDECGSQIPPDNYHFMKVDLPKEDFLNKNYGPFSRDNKEENVSFDQFVMKTLMSYLNQREIELFTPIDYQDDASPLTILFEKITRRFVEVLEHKFPKEREIIVIADQAAHFFPWPLLQDESTKVFLGDRYRVRTYPSILTMGVINHQKPRTIELPSEESFLVVGNPATPKFQHGGKEVTLGRLPHSETEALQVAHILETTPLLKEMATKPSVLYRLQTAQIIHIATHSSAVHGYLAFASSVPIVNTAKPVDSKEALIFIDEIQKLHINASLVVLSACDSARGQLLNEGVNSVARAFLAAGAQSVLVSLVRVPDKSASIFMSMFYRFLTHNKLTTSEAMQKSSMAIRCIKTLSQHIHWGGFQLVGRNIRMEYNEECHPAKVAAFVGETSPFPRLSVVQELEKAIFRQDRTPPRDVVLVQGMNFHDPAEIVRDFVVKRSKLFPGGVFWYNCSTPELLEASVTSVKKTLPHLKTIRKDPPKQPKRIDRKESMDPVPLFVEHYRLIILDSPFSLEECTRAIPDMKDQDVDIVIIDNMEANRDRKLSNFADSVLIRGCATIEVSDIDRYTSIQRMAYRLLCEQEFCPYEEDYEAFETIVRFCRGSSVLVKVFEGLLTSKEKGVLQSIAKDIDQVKEIVTSYEDTHTSPLQQPSLPSSHQSVSLASSLSSFPREVGKKVGRLGKKAKETKLTPAKNGLVESHNGLITADLAKRLSDEDYVLLSEGIEKVPRLMDSFCNFLSLRLSTEAHFLLQFLSYISGYPDVDSERPFVFAASFVKQLSTILPTSTQSSSSAPVEELRMMNLILLYPQPLLSPPERAADENLLYIPDIIVRIATYDIDEADIAFILNISSAIISQTNGILSPVYLKPVVSRILKLTECQRVK